MRYIFQTSCSSFIQEIEDLDQVAIAKMHNGDSESNEIRRFELLRNELIELEKRVQRSTDDAQNDEVIYCVIINVKLSTTADC